MNIIKNQWEYVIASLTRNRSTKCELNVVNPLKMTRLRVKPAMTTSVTRVKPAMTALSVCALLVLFCGNAFSNTPRWSVDHRRFSGSMIVTAVVFKGENELRSDEIEIGAFSGDDCRGSAILQYVPAADRYFGFLIIYGEGNEAITFKVYNHFTDVEETSTNASMNFVADAIFGSGGVPFVIALAPELWTVSVTGGSGSDIYEDGTEIEITADDIEGYLFVDWTIETSGGVEVSTENPYIFTVSEDIDLVANFELIVYTITYELDGGDNHPDNPLSYSIESPEIILQDPVREISLFSGWEEGNTIPAGSTGDLTFTALWNTVVFTVNVLYNNEHGSVSGDGVHEENASVTVVALANATYRFVNWTIDDVVVSTNTHYTFVLTDNVELVATFEPVLDFDTYVASKWRNNTFMLDLNRLFDDGYMITECRWYRNNGEFLYSGYTFAAGSQISDRFEAGIYWFVLTTSNRGVIRSSDKVIDERYIAANASITAYPNPVSSGNLLTIENVEEGSPIEVFNMNGLRVAYSIAGGSPATIVLDNLPAGVYVVRTASGEVKIVVSF